MSVVRHGEEIRCDKCGGELDAIPIDGANGESRFAFAMTHRRDGSPIGNLNQHGAFLGTIEATQCRACECKQAVIDSLDDEPEEWKKLPKWHKQQ